MGLHAGSVPPVPGSCFDVSACITPAILTMSTTAGAILSMSVEGICRECSYCTIIVLVHTISPALSIPQTMNKPTPVASVFVLGQLVTDASTTGTPC